MFYYNIKLLKYILIINLFSIFKCKLGRNDIFKDPSYIQSIKDIRKEVEEKIGKDIPDKISKHRNLYLHFKVADRDQNGKLDGAEVKSMLEHHLKPQDFPNYNINNENDIIEVIDGFMENVDKDKDGYLSYPEYIDYVTQ